VGCGRKQLWSLFQLLHELKPNDESCQRDFRVHMLNHPDDDHLFLDKAVSPDEDTFHF
jgi:hypothetical protein